MQRSDEMGRIFSRILLAGLLAGVASPGYSKGSGTSVGNQLLNDSNARVSALAGSVGADQNDIGAFGYNPASLPSLQDRQVALQHSHGLSDDRLSQVTAGLPLRKGTLGASLFYYDGGDFSLFDGTHHRHVTAQKDIALAVGYGQTSGSFDWGVTTKYLKSELIEIFSASALAFDFGAAHTIDDRLRLGISLNNIGTPLKYGSEKERLPRLLRFSSSYKLAQNTAHPTTIYTDLPYFMNERDLEFRGGVETLLGPLKLRAGYKAGVADLGGISLGTGFILGNATIDYSFDFIDHLSNAQQMSVTFKFGGSKRINKQEVYTTNNKIAEWSLLYPHHYYFAPLIDLSAPIDYPEPKFLAGDASVPFQLTPMPWITE